MQNFVICPNNAEEVPCFLEKAAPGFSRSEEFLGLEPEFKKIPGLVCGAFKDYLVRLQGLAEKGSADPQTLVELEKAYEAIETLASSNDPNVENLVVVEIYEHLALSNGALIRFKQHLKTKSLNLYKQWIE